MVQFRSLSIQSLFRFRSRFRSTSMVRFSIRSLVIIMLEAIKVNVVIVAAAIIIMIVNDVS